MESNLTNAACTAISPQRVRSEVYLVPVLFGFDGTSVSAPSPMSGVARVTKNQAGLAGHPGSPPWSPPV